jgi:hypothetical protein
MRPPRGALVVGSPEEVVQKILFEHELFGHKRFMAQISVRTLPHEKVMRAIELLAQRWPPQSAMRSSADRPRAPEDRETSEPRYCAAWSRSLCSILVITLFSRLPSTVAASDQAAYPTGRGRHRVEHRASTRVVPDVHHL